METKTEIMDIGHYRYETDMPREFTIDRKGCTATMLVDEKESGFVVKTGARIARFTDDAAFPAGRRQRDEQMRIWDARDACENSLSGKKPADADFFITRQDEWFMCPSAAESFVTGQRPDESWTADDGTVPVHWRDID